MKKFNTTGLCIPNKHYMVDTTDKINKIVKLIKDEEYFTINRSRQYGKTTTIYLLKNRLKSKYEIINISFEGIGEGPFSSNKRFVNMFIDRVAKAMKFTNIKEEDIASWTAEENYEEENAVVYLSDKISGLCEKYEIILMVDEMDKCSDNQVFLNFLGILREKYLSRNAGEDFTFKSVILAGVYDVKNLKLKLRSNEERKYNSPWNTREGIRKAVKNYYYADSTLKDDLIKNYENNTALNELIDDMLLRGMEYTFVSTDEAVSTGKIFGIFSKSKSGDGKLTISNIIFENILTDHVLMKYARAKIIRQPEKSQFIKEDGHLDMIRILDRFQALMKAEYRKKDEKFIESQGRLLFLCFLKPIINGTGFYYVEPQTRTSNRMDIVVTYLEEEFIIELKIWHGDQYRKDGIKQLNGYLESREQKKGYLVSFSFLKNKEYTSGYLSDVTTEEVSGIGDKEIYEVIV